jgi:hypothetical protein
VANTGDRGDQVGPDLAIRSAYFLSRSNVRKDPVLHPHRAVGLLLLASCTQEYASSGFSMVATTFACYSASRRDFFRARLRANACLTRRF